MEDEREKLQKHRVYLENQVITFIHSIHISLILSNHNRESN